MPCGNVTEPTPGRTGLLAIETVGDPPIPVPLLTSIWFDVPRIDVEETVPPVVRVKMPFTLAFAKFKTCPDNETVGLPDTPSPLDTDKPAVPAAIVRPVSVVLFVLTCSPVPELLSDRRAPVVVTFITP